MNSHSPLPTTARTSRIESVDQFRGFAIISMILINYLALFRATPSWLKHSPGVGYTFADLVAPYFIFIIGLMYASSYASRAKRDGKRMARTHFLRRYGLLILIGAALGVAGFIATKVAIRLAPEAVRQTAGARDPSAWASSVLYWGVLQAIGAAGILGLVFVEFPSWARFLGGCFLLLVYHIVMRFVGTGIVLRFPHGGPLASVGWGAMLIFSTVFSGELRSGSRRRTAFFFLIPGVILTAVGINLSSLNPLAKNIVSGPYVFLSTGLSALTFLVFFLVVDCAGVRLPHLASLGRNALLLYIVHHLFVVLAGAVVGHEAGGPYVAAGAGAVYLACYLLALFLDRRSIYLKL